MGYPDAGLARGYSARTVCATAKARTRPAAVSIWLIVRKNSMTWWLIAVPVATKSPNPHGWGAGTIRPELNAKPPAAGRTTMRCV